MNKKPTIRIIKRAEASRVRKAPAASPGKQPDPTRKVIETVSGWVRDFKRKSNAEGDSLLAAFLEETRDQTRRRAGASVPLRSSGRINRA